MPYVGKLQFFCFCTGGEGGGDNFPPQIYIKGEGGGHGAGKAACPMCPVDAVCHPAFPENRNTRN